MCWFGPNSFLKLCDWCLFSDAEVGSAAISHMRWTPFHQWKCCVRAAEVCSHLPPMLCWFARSCGNSVHLEAVKGSAARLVFDSWLEVFLSGICTFSPDFSWCLVSQYEKMNLTLSRSSYCPSVWERTVTKFMHNYTNCFINVKVIDNCLKTRLHMCIVPLMFWLSDDKLHHFH